jgi:hypothetical protein
MRCRIFFRFLREINDFLFLHLTIGMGLFIGLSLYPELELLKMISTYHHKVFLRRPSDIQQVTDQGNQH